jgi:hypothetical protein
VFANWILKVVLPVPLDGPRNFEVKLLQIKKIANDFV